MISGKALDEVITEYHRARFCVNDAAVLLEKSLVTMPRTSRPLIHVCNELFVEMGNAIDTLSAITPDD